MILHLRNGKHVYEVDVPRGSEIRPNAHGLPVLIIPGPSPVDTATWLPAPEILDAARLGLHGLALRPAQRLAAACH